MVNTIRTRSLKLWTAGLLATCSVVAVAFYFSDRPDPVMQAFIKRIESMPKSVGLALVDNHDGSVTITDRDIEVPHTMTFTADHALLAVKADRSTGFGNFMFVVFEHPTLGPLAMKDGLNQTSGTEGDFRVVELTISGNTDLSMLEQSKSN
jgi:hypothetical protein